MSYKINKYPDGTSYVTIPKEWENSLQKIIFRVNNYENLWHLNQLCEVMNWNNVQGHIIIPCLLDSQADRRFGEFKSCGLTLIADLLNEYKGISYGIFHPHNPEVVEALFNRVEIIDNSNFIKNVLNKLHKDNEERYPLIYSNKIGKPNFSNLILMSPDAGAFKPLMKLCNKIKWKGQTVSASKSRLYDGEKSHLVQQIQSNDFEGKDILIVDDICVQGGTFKGLSKLLRERNCGKLYLAVSHMTVQDLGEDPVSNYFDKVFVTNSKYDIYYKQELMNLDGGGERLYRLENEPLENLEIIKMF